MKARSTQLFVLLWFAAAPGRLQADPVPMSAGLVPVPQQSSEVALVQEDLQIDVQFTFMDVQATMVLENRGPAVQLPVGFPCLAVPEESHELLSVGLDCRTKIDVKAGGVPQKPVRQKTGPREHHWVWPMRFEAGQRVELQVAYRQPMVNERYSRPVDGMWALTYRLSTGAQWAGPIGRLDMQVRLPVEAIVHIAPAGFTRELGVIRWSLIDHEPAGDLAIFLSAPGASRFLGAFAAKTHAEYRQRREAGKFDARRLVELAEELEQRPEELHQEASFVHQMISRHLDLAAPEKAAIEACARESARLIRELASRAAAP